MSQARPFRTRLRLQILTVTPPCRWLKARAIPLRNRTNILRLLLVRRVPPIIRVVRRGCRGSILGVTAIASLEEVRVLGRAWGRLPQTSRVWVNFLVVSRLGCLVAILILRLGFPRAVLRLQLVVRRLSRVGGRGASCRRQVRGKAMAGTGRWGDGRRATRR